MTVARRRFGYLGAIFVGFGSAFLAVYYLTVRTIPGRVLSDASLRGALLTGSPLGRFVDAVLNVVSVASLSGALALIAIIALVRLQRVPGLAAVAVLAGANVSTWLLKAVLVRPDLGLREVAPPTLNSLPSGHSTAAFSALTALLFVLPGRWRRATATIGVGYATVTALATMSAGWHRAGDSMAAFLLVGMWATAAATMMIILGGPAAAPADPTGSLRWLAAGSVGAFALGTVVASALAIDEPIRESTAGWSAAFLAGGLLICGTAAAVTIGVLTALDLVDAPGPRPRPADPA